MQGDFSPSHRGGSGAPLVCLHGFMDTWRSWELLLGALERHHDVLAVTLPGHAGGPPLEGRVTDALMADQIERAMDDVDFASAHIVGNSLGGYVALQLAERERARSVVAFAPAGGWAEGDESFRETLALQARTHAALAAAAPFADMLVASEEGRRRATQLIVTSFEHIPEELLVHQLLGAARCETDPLVDHALRVGYTLDASRIACPVRVVWGTEDKLLPWPSAAARLREDWLPHADWIELEGVGHCPQLEIPLEAAQLILGFTTA